MNNSKLFTISVSVLTILLGLSIAYYLIIYMPTRDKIKQEQATLKLEEGAEVGVVEKAVTDITVSTEPTITLADIEKIKKENQEMLSNYNQLYIKLNDARNSLSNLKELLLTAEEFRKKCSENKAYAKTHGSEDGCKNHWNGEVSKINGYIQDRENSITAIQAELNALRNSCDICGNSQPSFSNVPLLDSSIRESLEKMGNSNNGISAYNSEDKDALQKQLDQSIKQGLNESEIERLQKQIGEVDNYIEYCSGVANDISAVVANDVANRNSVMAELKQEMDQFGSKRPDRVADLQVRIDELQNKIHSTITSMSSAAGCM